VSTKSLTKPSTYRLSDHARHVVAPKGVVSTGWPAVEAKCAELGISFRPWQPDVGRLILAKRADGKYAATIGGTGLSIPRQVGKTFLVGAIVFALCLLRPNLTVIWTAHRVRTAEETFKKMQAFAKRKRIAPHVLKITLGSGEEAIEFRNGSRILFGARASGFGLGFDEVDVLIFDEAQRLTDTTLDDMIPAANQSRQPTSALVLFMGTPPRPTDRGEQFTRMRTEALSGEDDDTGWVEFGADPSHRPATLPAPLTEADWKQIAKANPSYPQDTPREAILRMRKKLGPDSFLREGMGIWDDFEATKLVMPKWHDRVSRNPPNKPAALGIAVDLDRVWVSVGAASIDTMPHLGPVTAATPGGPMVLRRRLDRDRALIVSEVARIQREHSCAVVIDRKGPAGSLERDLLDAGVVITPAGLDDNVTACADLYDAIESGTAVHGGYSELDDAVIAASIRKVGDRWAWARRNGEISMLEAVTLALWGARQLTTTEAWGFYE